MAESLLGLQRAMRSHVLAPPDATEPPTWLAPDQAAGALVYRNNVLYSLCEALAAQFPASHALVGPGFFGALSRDYVRTHPPTVASLTFYGDAMPAFVDASAHCLQLPWLADLMRLELARRGALHAADDVPLDVSHLATLDGDALLDAPQRLRADVQLLRSRWAVHNLHAAALMDGARVNPRASALLLVHRLQGEVVMQPIVASLFDLLEQLQAGLVLAPAWEHVRQAHGLDDDALAPLFGELLALQVLAAPDTAPLVCQR